MKILPVRNPSKVGDHLQKYLGRWQQNNSPSDLGIVRFIFDLYEINKQLGYPALIRDFKPEYGVAPWAADALSSWFTYEKGMSKEDWCHVVATHREGSKTTWYSWALPLYLMLIGQHGIYHKDTLLPEFDYIVLRGKNNREAKKRILNVNNFFNRPLIKLLFGELRPTFKQVREKEAKDEGGLLILPNGYIFECSGIEQPSRGLNLFSVRPKLFVFDDVQNKENTKTQERREQIDAEVMNESFGAVADEGSMIYIGNKVHASDTLGRLLDDKNPIWKKHFYTLTVRKENGTTYPGVGDLDTEVPLWDKRWTIDRVKKLKSFFESQPDMGGIKGFLKEYYNIIKSDADYKIRFYNAEYKKEHGINWLIFNNPDGTQEYRNVTIVVANDPAISERKKSSDAVVTTLAVDAEHRRYILEMNYGKWDLHDRFFDDMKAPPVIAHTPEEIANIKRRGSVEEIGRMVLKYHPDAVNIEVAGQQWTFYNETKKLLDLLGWKGTLRPEPAPAEGKDEKLRQVPLIYFETGLYYLPAKSVDGELKVRDDMAAIRNDITAFPDCRKDRLDSIYLAEQVLTFPIKIPYSPLGYPKVDKSIQPEELLKTRSSLLNDHEGWVTI